MHTTSAKQWSRGAGIAFAVAWSVATLARPVAAGSPPAIVTLLLVLAHAGVLVAAAVRLRSEGQPGSAEATIDAALIGQLFLAFVVALS